MVPVKHPTKTDGTPLVLHSKDNIRDEYTRCGAYKEPSAHWLTRIRADLVNRCEVCLSMEERILSEEKRLEEERKRSVYEELYGDGYSE